MKILVTGSNGQLGSELRTVLESLCPGRSVYTSSSDLDITDRRAVEAFMRQGAFSHVVNCAAYTAVDRAEEEKLRCAEVNIDGISNIARLADELNYKILHISTDYVFDGTNNRPYTESDKPAPLSVYGSTKRKGETALLGLAPQSIIIRTGWLYSAFGRNFVKTILGRADKADSLRVVFDQVGTPTYAADLAAAIVEIITRHPWKSGIYNYANEGVASWYDFATAILCLAGMPDKAAQITPILSADYSTPALRPSYSVLDKSKIKATFGLAISHWQTALQRCLKNL